MMCYRCDVCGTEIRGEPGKCLAPPEVFVKISGDIKIPVPNEFQIRREVCSVKCLAFVLTELAQNLYPAPVEVKAAIIVVEAPGDHSRGSAWRSVWREPRATE